MEQSEGKKFEFYEAPSAPDFTTNDEEITQEGGYQQPIIS